MSYKPFVLPPVTTNEDHVVTQNSGVNEANVPTVTTVTTFRNRYIYSESVPSENDIAIIGDDRAQYVSDPKKSGNSGNSGNIGASTSRELPENVLHMGGNSGNIGGNTDLICYIGYTIDAMEWAWLQGECLRRHGPTWQLSAEQCSEGYKVTGLRVTP